MSWKDDKRWSDQFVPAIKHLLADTFICEAPKEKDQHENTDLMVFTVAPYSVACRVRNAEEYLEKYPHDVTIRLARPASGNKTEWDKLVDGWADFMVYAFGSVVPRVRLAHWVMIDLKALRAQLIREPGRIARSEHLNSDNSSSFVALSVPSLDEGVIKRRSADYGRRFDRCKCEWCAASREAAA